MAERLGNARWSVAQLGARMHYSVPRIFNAAGRLDHLFTDICAWQGWGRALSLMPAVAQPAAVRRLASRIPHTVPRQRIVSFSTFGLAYAYRRSRARSQSELSAAHLWAGERFGGMAGSILRRRPPDLIYGFNTASWVLFAQAPKGTVKVLEQTIAPLAVERQILSHECALHPEWSVDLRDDFAERIAEVEALEWSLADLIVCPSDFVRQGVVSLGAEVTKCVVVPYGVDLQAFSKRHNRKAGGKLRVLTVGTAGIRKGSHVLAAAARELKPYIEFRVVGPNALPPAIAAEVCADLPLVGVVTRSQIREQYDWADVFVLPSLCEGSATSIYEALAAGLPVICTPNAGSVVRHGIEGLLVEPGDVPDLVEALRRLAMDHNEREAMAENARARAKEFGLEQYALRLNEQLERHIDGR